MRVLVGVCIVERMRGWEELEGERKEGEKNLLKTRVHQWEQLFPFL